MKNLIQKVQNIISRNSQVIWGTIIHITTLWISLSLGYNSYKEYLRETAPLSRAAKDSIKAAFSWAMLAFLILYLLIYYRKKMDGFFLKLWQYALMIFIYTALLNLSYMKSGLDVLICLNLSTAFFITFLPVIWMLSRNVDKDSKNKKDLIQLQNLLPPILYDCFVNNMPSIKAYVKEKPSAPFILLFMLLLIICLFILMLKRGEPAGLFTILYFSLFAGIIIELYQTVKLRK